jgi:sigma-E factor negative regulatory protein RseA
MRDGGPSDAGQELVSAWVDGEAQDLQAGYEAVVGSADGRRLWDEYHLIGDVLRSEALAASGGAIAGRVMAQLQSEPAIVAAPRSAAKPAARRWMRRYAMPGLAAAAAVAVITWGVVPQLMGTSGQAEPVQVAEQVVPTAPVRVAAPAIDAAAPPMPVEAMDASNIVHVAAPQQIDPYLIAHQQSIFGAGRRNGAVQPVSSGASPSQ